MSRSQVSPVRVFDDAPVDPLLQDFEVGDAGGFGEVQAQLLGPALSVGLKSAFEVQRVLSALNRSSLC